MARIMVVDDSPTDLQNLKDMRYADNSMGTKQLLQWPDLLTNAAAGLSRKTIAALTSDSVPIRLSGTCSRKVGIDVP